MARRTKTVPRIERLELIRQMLIAGIPEWEIKRELAKGVDMGDGRTCRVKRAQLQKDLNEIGLVWKTLHDDPMVVERVVGAVHTRLARIAHKAEDAKRYHEAIRANLAIVNIVSRRSTRWVAGAKAEEVAPTQEVETELERMSDDELRAKLAKERANVLRLVKG